MDLAHNFQTVCLGLGENTKGTKKIGKIRKKGLKFIEKPFIMEITPDYSYRMQRQRFLPAFYLDKKKGRGIG